MTIYYQPYTYLIGWSKFDRWYYGVRYAKGCKPEDLWVTYFTSSKHVTDFRTLYGEPDIIQIRQVFNDAEKALRCEERVLRKFNVMSNDKWLNRSINGVYAKVGMSKTLAHRQNVSLGRMGIQFTEEHRHKIRLANLNRTATEETKSKMSATRRGVSKSPECRKRMSEAHLGKPKSKHIQSTCPHCNHTGGIGAMKRWHFDNCKSHSSSSLSSSESASHSSLNSDSPQNGQKHTSSSS